MIIMDPPSNFNCNFGALLQSTLPFIHLTLPSETFIHFWTSSLIINMLNSPNITRMPLPSVQENSSSGSASRQIHQSSQLPNPQILPLTAKAPRKAELMVYWKKQIKRYLMGIGRRQSTVFLKTLEKDFGLALNLMGNEPLVKNGNVIKSSSKAFSPRFPPLRTIAPAKRVWGPSNLFLSAPPENFLKSDLFFELTVLGASGKILYNAIMLRNWQDIQKELSFIQSHSTILSRFVEEKQNILSRLPSKQTEFRELLSSLIDLQGGVQPTGFNRFSSSHIPSRMDHENREQKDGASGLELVETLKVFMFLRREILYNTIKKSGHDVPMWTWPYCSVIYNLLLPIVNSTSIPFSEQIKDFLPSLETLLLKFIQHSETQFQSKRRNSHHPMTLVNAHLCLSCKERRGYIACHSCSLVEAKTVSLCLQCYQPFHAEIKREVEQQKQQFLVENWQSLQADVTFFIENMMQIPSYPFESQVKKEQQQ